MDCSLPGSSVHGILQARILEWVTISFSNNSGEGENLSGKFRLILNLIYCFTMTKESILDCSLACLLIPLSLIWKLKKNNVDSLTFFFSPHFFYNNTNSPLNNINGFLTRRIQLIKGKKVKDFCF